MECFENAENELFNSLSLDGKNDETKYQALMKCQCLPQCQSLKYELELVKTNYKSLYCMKIQHSTDKWIEELHVVLF
jgi:hypothetical protein